MTRSAISAHPLYAAMGTTVFERMSALARAHGAINLGQGFPDDDGPPSLREAAARALRERSNQYPPSPGLPELRDAVARFYAERQGLALGRDHVIVTSGATEGLAAAFFALIRPGDEAILFTPAYDAYAPLIRRAGGTPVAVPLRPPHWRYERAAIEAAITPRTRLMVVNDPLNPAGSVASADNLAMLAELCVARDLFAVCDEVWETVRFDGAAHRSLMTFPGMPERAVKLGSAGKVFGLTGWKVGWMIAAPELAAVLGKAHQFLTFTTPPALQWAVADGLAHDAVIDGLVDGWAATRAMLAEAIADAGYVALPNAATWFTCIDLAASGIALGDVEFCDRAVAEAGVATIPLSAFGESGQPSHLVRLCHCKPAALLHEAAARLGAFRAKLLAET
ncbi:MAG: aminotransferase [Novosphingobium sp.]